MSLAKSTSHIISLLNHNNSPEKSEDKKGDPESKAVTPLPPSTTTPAANTDSTADQNQSKSQQHPRKRSKVSRLCDECRRKKIKCDAALNSISLAALSSNIQCSNCTKMGEYCSFTRVPLKRGPTKGYIRDFEGKVDMENRRNSHSASAAGVVGPPLPSTSAYQSLDSQKKEFFTHHLPPLPVSGSVSSGSSLSAIQLVPPPPNSHQVSAGPPIVLPPIDHHRSSATSNITLSPRSSVPNIDSHRTNAIQLPSAVALLSAGSNNNNTSAQGHFWKVPYEYSAFNNERRGSLDSLSSSISDSFSTPFYGIGGNGGESSSHNKKLRTHSSSVVSDSDDELYLRKSSIRSPTVMQPHLDANTASTSISSASQKPKKMRSPDSLSISSLSSLNNKLTLDLNLENRQHLRSAIDLKTLESNVLLYYENYHENIFILPMNSSKFLHSIGLLSLQSEVEIFIVDLFNSSLLLLNNSNKNSTLFIDDIRLVFQQIVKTYPPFSKEILSNEFWKLLYLSTLVILNYCIVLSGNDYSVGLNVNIAVFNDFKIDKLVVELDKTSSTTTQLDYDDIIVIYSRLYFNLFTFDRLHALSYGKNASLNPPVPGSLKFPIAKMLPPQHCSVYEYQELLINGLEIHKLPIEHLKKCLTLLNSEKSKAFDENVILSSWKTFVNVYDLVIEMKQNYQKQEKFDSLEDDEEEYIFDNFLKITRSVKKLITDLTKIFDNFYQFSNSKKNLHNYSPLLSCISFKILLLLKNLIISIIKFQKKIGNHDLMSRLKKLEIELNTIFYKVFKNLNFENMNLSANLNFINQRFNKSIQFYDNETKVDHKHNTFYGKIDEWLNHLDQNFVNLVNDEEYGWLL